MSGLVSGCHSHGTGESSRSSHRCPGFMASPTSRQWLREHVLCNESTTSREEPETKPGPVSGKKDEHKMLIRRSGDVMRRRAQMWEEHLTMWSQHIVQTTYVGLLGQPRTHRPSFPYLTRYFNVIATIPFPNFFLIKAIS